MVCVNFALAHAQNGETPMLDERASLFGLRQPTDRQLGASAEMAGT
jgi:hypothetical protein